jgi:hypothetical protein
LKVVALARHADGDAPDASPPFRFGSRSLVLIAAKGDSMSVLVGDPADLRVVLGRSCGDADRLENMEDQMLRKKF